MIETNTMYNEADSEFTPAPKGTYPCHLASFESREYNGNKVFNIQFKVAQEADKLMFMKMVSDGDGWYEQEKNENGEGLEISGKSFVGRKFFSVGVWFTPKPMKEEGWKNKTYKKWFESLGVIFKKDGDNIVLGEVEESDVVGKPCLANVDVNEYENKDGELRRSMQVVSIEPWKDGTELDKSEMEDDLPF